MDRSKFDTIDFSVVIVTYNHQPFLAQAIESVIKQEFSKNMDVIIAVDKSNDKTAEVARSYQNRYPEVIRCLVHPKRVGMFGNFKSAFASCRGKYIAILEGDDYWTDKHKLQAQYDFFEENEHCILSAGLYGTIQNGEAQKNKPILPFLFTGKVFRKDDLVFGNRLATLTTAFRTKAFDLKEFEKLQYAPHLDWGIYLSLDYTEHSFIYRFNKIFGNYRLHEGGIYSMVGNERRNVNFLKTIYAIYFLKLEAQQKSYLQYLFSNYSYTHNVSGFLTQEPYKSFYDPSLIIYESKNKLKRRYVKQILEITYREREKIKSNRNSLVRFNFELIRQTKYSKAIYLDLKLVPFLIAVFIEKVKNMFNNNSLVKK